MRDNKKMGKNVVKAMAFGMAAMMAVNPVVAAAETTGDNTENNGVVADGTEKQATVEELMEKADEDLSAAKGEAKEQGKEVEEGLIGDLQEVLNSDEATDLQDVVDKTDAADEKIELAEEKIKEAEIAAGLAALAAADAQQAQNIEDAEAKAGEASKQAGLAGDAVTAANGAVTVANENVTAAQDAFDEVSEAAENAIEAAQAIDGENTAAQTTASDFAEKEAALHTYKVDENGKYVLDEEGNKILESGLEKDLADAEEVLAGKEEALADAEDALATYTEKVDENGEVVTDEDGNPVMELTDGAEKDLADALAAKTALETQIQKLNAAKSLVVSAKGGYDAASIVLLTDEQMSAIQDALTDAGVNYNVDDQNHLNDLETAYENLVAALQTAEDALHTYQKDENGNFVYDENGNKVLIGGAEFVYNNLLAQKATAEKAVHTYDESGNLIGGKEKELADAQDEVTNKTNNLHTYDESGKLTGGKEKELADAQGDKNTKEDALHTYQKDAEGNFVYDKNGNKILISGAEKDFNDAKSAYNTAVFEEASAQSAFDALNISRETAESYSTLYNAKLAVDAALAKEGATKDSDEVKAALAAYLAEYARLTGKNTAGNDAHDDYISIDLDANNQIVIHNNTWSEAETEYRFLDSEGNQLDANTVHVGGGQNDTVAIALGEETAAVDLASDINVTGDALYTVTNADGSTTTYYAASADVYAGLQEEYAGWSDKKKAVEDYAEAFFKNAKDGEYLTITFAVWGVRTPYNCYSKKAVTDVLKYYNNGHNNYIDVTDHKLGTSTVEGVAAVTTKTEERSVQDQSNENHWTFFIEEDACVYGWGTGNTKSEAEAWAKAKAEENAYKDARSKGVTIVGDVVTTPYYSDLIFPGWIDAVRYKYSYSYYVTSETQRALYSDAVVYNGETVTTRDAQYDQVTAPLADNGSGKVDAYGKYSTLTQKEGALSTATTNLGIARTAKTTAETNLSNANSTLITKTGEYNTAVSELQAAEDALHTYKTDENGEFVLDKDGNKILIGGAEKALLDAQAEVTRLEGLLSAALTEKGIKESAVSNAQTNLTNGKTALSNEANSVIENLKDQLAAAEAKLHTYKTDENGKQVLDENGKPILISGAEKDYNDAVAAKEEAEQAVENAKGERDSAKTVRDEKQAAVDEAMNELAAYNKAVEAAEEEVQATQADVDAAREYVNEVAEKAKNLKDLVDTGVKSLQDALDKAESELNTAMEALEVAEANLATAKEKAETAKTLAEAAEKKVEAAKKAAEEEAAKKAAEEATKKAQDEAAAKQAAEEAAKKAADEAAQKAADEAAAKAAQEQATRLAEEEAARQASIDAARQANDAAKKAADEAAAKAAEEAARKAAENVANQNAQNQAPATDNSSAAATQAPATVITEETPALADAPATTAAPAATRNTNTANNNAATQNTENTENTETADQNAADNNAVDNAEENTNNNETVAETPAEEEPTTIVEEGPALSDSVKTSDIPEDEIPMTDGKVASSHIALIAGITSAAAAALFFFIVLFRRKKDKKDEAQN